MTTKNKKKKGNSLPSQAYQYGDKYKKAVKDDYKRKLKKGKEKSKVPKIILIVLIILLLLGGGAIGTYYLFFNDEESKPILITDPTNPEGEFSLGYIETPTIANDSGFNYFRLGWNPKNDINGDYDPTNFTFTNNDNESFELAGYQTEWFDNSIHELDLFYEYNLDDETTVEKHWLIDFDYDSNIYYLHKRDDSDLISYRFSYVNGSFMSDPNASHPEIGFAKWEVKMIKG